MLQKVKMPLWRIDLIKREVAKTRCKYPDFTMSDWVRSAVYEKLERDAQVPVAAPEPARVEPRVKRRAG